MQVKKFEAKSMKEALQLVKSDLGPEAIILSVKDNTQGFGLVGEKSIEVTAAIAEQVLRRKHLAEKRLNAENRLKYSNSSAKSQKEFIHKVFEQKALQEERRPITSVSYIDIQDEEGHEGANSQEAEASERIRSAAKKAWEAVQSTVEEERKVAEEPPALETVEKTEDEVPSSEVLALRKEIRYLKELIDKFQNVPQSFVSLHPGADEGIPFELSFMYEKLTRAGVSKENTVEILKSAESKLPAEKLKKRAFVDAWVAKFLLDHIDIAQNRSMDRYHLFVGASGQGRTSALVKFASHLIICEKKKVAILTTDRFKVGAAEQLKIYAQILNVPFAVVRKNSDWEIVQSKLSGYDHILVDYPGFNLKSMNEVDTLRSLLSPETGGRAIHFVQSVLAKDKDVFEITKRYLQFGLKDVIFTCLDESTQHGLIYNFQKEYGLPLHSFGIGSNIPEDFEAATKERVVDLLFKLTKIRKDRS